MRGRVAAAVLLASSGCASLPATTIDRPSVESARSGYARLAAQALPSVVLLLRREPEGALHFGAGFIVEHGPPGSVHVLTASHVVSGPGTLQALFYDRARTSYTPMDGGLDRLLFENQGALRPATLLDQDPVGDLALVAIEPDPRVAAPPLPRLRLSTIAPRVGDEVLALGHPQETVWSFTRGVVSGLHRDTIQHDAVSSGGSSGGPLLALDGTVIGINTSKIVSAVRGLGFARPVTRAHPLLVGTTTRLPRDTPEVAVRSCWQAQEMGSPALSECFDWPSAWSDVQHAIDVLQRALPDDAARVRRDLAARGGYAGFLTRNQNHIVDEYHLGSPISPLGKVQLTGLREAYRRARASGRAADEVRAMQVARSQNGVRVELSDAGLRQVLRKGLRVDEVRMIEDRAAWVRLGGRNPDGSGLTFSELWVKSNDGWRQRRAAGGDAPRTLPVGWPPPLEDLSILQHELLDQLLERAEALAQPTPGPAGGPRVAPR